MIVSEYRQIVEIINKSTYEKLIYQEIERQLQAHGWFVTDLNYTEYVQLRNRLDAMNRVPFAQAVLEQEQKSKENPKRRQPRKKLSKEEKDQIIGTLFVAAFLTVLAFLLPIGFLMPLLSLAFVVLILGLVDFIPIPKWYNIEYVEKRSKAQTDARLQMEAFLHQAYLHKDQIRILNEQLNQHKR